MLGGPKQREHRRPIKLVYIDVHQIKKINKLFTLTIRLGYDDIRILID